LAVVRFGGWLMLLAAWPVVGCGEPDNSLDGSIKDSRDLSFDTVQIRFIKEQQSYDVQYLKALEAGGDDDIVAKIAFTVPDGGIKAGKAVDLAADGVNGVVQRNTAAGTSDTFPADFEKASITFASEPKAGEPGDGEFACTFDNGKTLFGNFLAEIEEAGF
jgi:hypothetical protein